MKTTSLIGLGISGAGVATGAGVGISYYYGGQSIENYLTNSKEYKNRVFLNANTSGLDEIVKAYQDSKRLKPKYSNEKNLEKDNLIKWCNNAIKGTYYGEGDHNFDLVVSWCYINTNSLEDELNGSKKTKISESSPEHQDWKTAWNNYFNKKNTNSLRIKEIDDKSNLNVADSQEGQKALMNWCLEKAKINMYVDDAKDYFDRFENWCTNQ